MAHQKKEVLTMAEKIVTVALYLSQMWLCVAYIWYAIRWRKTLLSKIGEKKDGENNG